MEEKLKVKEEENESQKVITNQLNEELLSVRKQYENIQKDVSASKMYISEIENLKYQLVEKDSLITNLNMVIRTNIYLLDNF